MTEGQSAAQIEAEIEAVRARLAGTIDELAFRAQPKQIALRQSESIRASFRTATRADDGSLRIERIAAVLGVVAVLAIGLGLLRRRNS